MTAPEIRKKFIDFFAAKEHTVVPSAPLVIKNDPTLMFTNAGMNQFKDYFLGNKPIVQKRIVDTQKCLRVSGKHNDLEEVGVDTYHHTMFEMLGNWSFGDYFKKEAIAWSWELLTKEFKIDTDRIYVTIFEGDKKENLPKDEEAFSEWKKHIAIDRILLGNKKDNFWEMGDTGPCGPCTEIHVDCRTDDERKKTDGKNLINNDHPQVIEIWNNVFIQFNRQKDGKLTPLSAVHVDTGMGLERLVRVLQKKNSNYDTDIFSGTIAATEKITGKKYEANDTKQAIAFRVLADHIRAIGFTITDGQLPSNTGAGYVIRRILRRAIRYYYSHLDYKQPLLFQLLPVIANQFENVFPELQKQIDFISKVVHEEEEAFLRTLEKGLKRIADVIDSTTSKTISGKDAFELYDTYGFPIDLTRLIASENNFAINEKEFEGEMLQQRQRSRAATVVDADEWRTIDATKSNKFIGYQNLESTSKVIKYRKIKTKGKESFQFVLDQTPFYAESGGQIGDTGWLNFGNEKIEVTNTKKENELIIHFTDSIPAEISETVLATVDAAKRKEIAIHHTATHLVHAALRKILGIHVEQKGSLVTEKILRFDFSHFSKLNKEEITKIEKQVNEKIRQNISVVIKECSKDEAMKMGAMALFGEKYGDVVRVVIIDPNYSVELCGGTHVGSTGELGYFSIIHETAVAAGVRRIEAVCGSAAEKYILEIKTEFENIKSQFKNPKNILNAIENTLSENNDLKKQLEQVEKKEVLNIQGELLKKVSKVNGINFIGECITLNNSESLKKLSIELQKNVVESVIVLCAVINSKPFVSISISEKIVLEKKVDANKWIKEIIAPLINGGGGGQKTLATAGGQDVSQINQVLTAIKNELVKV